MSLYKVLATQIWTSRTLSQNGGGGLVAKSCPTLVTPWIGSQPGTSVHSPGSSRQEYWSGLPFPSPGDISNSGIKPRSPALQADSLLTELQGKALSQNRPIKNIYLSNMFVFTFSRLQFWKKILIIKWKDKSICAFPSPYFLIHYSACSVSSWKYL